jgi:hypothetical protein
MNTRRTFAALVLVGTTLSLTGAIAVSPASALSAASPFCRALGQLPINLASFGPTASLATLKTVAKTDSRINATALRLLANDASGDGALSKAKNIQFYTHSAVGIAAFSERYAIAIVADPTSPTAITDAKLLKGESVYSAAMAPSYLSLLVALHQTQSKVCPNIHPIVATSTTAAATTVIQTGTNDGNTVTTSDIPTIGINTGGINPLNPPTHPGK